MFKDKSWLEDTLYLLEQAESQCDKETNEIKAALIKQGVREWESCKSDGRVVSCPPEFIDFIMQGFANTLHSKEFTSLHAQFGLIQPRANKSIPSSALGLVVSSYLVGYLAGYTAKLLNRKLQLLSYSGIKGENSEYHTAKVFGMKHGLEGKKLCAERLKEAFCESYTFVEKESAKQYYRKSKVAFEAQLQHHHSEIQWLNEQSKNIQDKRLLLTEIESKPIFKTVIKNFPKVFKS